MKINTKNALKLWEQIFGDREYATDFSGTLICKKHYNDRNKTTPFVFNYKNQKYTIKQCTGWNIHHVLPISKGGSDDEDNLEIVNMEVHDQIEDKTSFTINGITYQIKREKGNTSSHYIEQVK